MEMNPGTITKESMAQIYQTGVNRVSLGVQSCHPDILRLLQRNHTHLDTIDAVYYDRSARFQNLSLDLIFGVPGQSIEQWSQSLALAVGLNPEHISLYGLTIEPGTPFSVWEKKGLFPVTDDDISADRLKNAAATKKLAIFDAFEILNRIKEEEDMLNQKPKKETEKKSFSGFAEGRAK